MPKFWSLPNIVRVRRDFVSNSWLLVENTTQIGAKIAVLSGAAYPEFRLTNLNSG